MKKLALLTSSRADYSIYLPLIKVLAHEQGIKLDIIAFGTHNQEKYGLTFKEIENDGFNIAYKIKSSIDSFGPDSIAQNIATTINDFTAIWQSENYDLIICLGDRYEMFAAVTASIPFNIPIAHISGGETTLGAIDNKFRHALTIFSSLHFTSTEAYKQRVIELLGYDNNVFNTGALSIDNLKNINLFSTEEFKQKFNIDITKPSILITFHPETSNIQQTPEQADELVAALGAINGFQYIITMPNADTYGDVIRQKLNNFIANNHNAVGVESFGTIGYLTCMKYCKMMLGNTSSGFVEASFFPKYVINLGDRQKGRLLTKNIFNVSINRQEIIEAVNKINQLPPLEPQNIYGDGTASKKMVFHIKSFLGV